MHNGITAECFILFLMLHYRICNSAVIDMLAFSKGYAVATVRRAMNSLLAVRYVQETLLFPRRYVSQKTAAQVFYRVNYSVIPYAKATAHQKRYGEKIYELTSDGLQYFVRKYADCIGIGESLEKYTQKFIVANKDAAGESRYRLRCAAISEIMIYLIGGKTSLSPRPGGNWWDNETTHNSSAATFESIMRASLREYAEDAPYQMIEECLKDGPVYYTKAELAGSQMKELKRWPALGALLIAEEILYVYHTKGRLGTSWSVKNNKKPLSMIRAAIWRIAPRKYTSISFRGIMFVANSNEVEELILSSRRDTAKVKSNSVVRFTSNKSHSTTVDLIAKPLSGLYLIPENVGGLRQLKWLATKETWDEQDRPYNLFLNTVGNRQIVENDTICPKCIIEFKRIYKKLLPEAIKWETVDKITPIFLGYFMDLQEISELYYLHVEKECNGVVTASNGTQLDNLAIFCWDWQHEYYVRLFPNAIYFLTEDDRTI